MPREQSTGDTPPTFLNTTFDYSSAECSYAKDFAKGKYLYSNGDFRSGFKLVEKAIIKGLSGIHYCSQSNLEHIVELNGFVKFKKEVFELLAKLPNTDCTLGEWICETNKIFKDANIEIDLKIKKSKGNITFEQLFGMDNLRITKSGYRIGTIHSIKGETYEAVLVILKTKGVGAMYKTMLRNNIKISDEEELRIVYVGITRPRRLLLLAVPDERRLSR